MTFLVQLCLFEMQISSFVGVAKWQERSKGREQCISLGVDPLVASATESVKRGLDEGGVFQGRSKTE